MNANSRLVTLIVPVYNVEKYLDKCINSILVQTYQNIEIILINDGSTDDSPAICDKFARKDSRVHVVHKSNGGVSSARNQGLNVARGDYVMFIDSDDWIEKDMVESMLNVAEDNNAQMVLCDINWIDSNEEISTEVHSYFENDTVDVLEGKDIYYKFFLKSTQMCDKLWNKHTINGIRFNEDVAYGEDVKFILETIVNAERVAMLPEKKYNYRYSREGNVCSSHIDDRILDLIKVSEETYDKLREDYPAVGVNCISKTVAYVYHKIPVQEVFFLKAGKYDSYIKACFKALKKPKIGDIYKYIKDDKLQYVYKRFLVIGRLCPKWWFLRNKLTVKE